MTLVIRGIGTAVPDHSIQQRDAAEMWKSFLPSDEVGERTLKALFRRSGVQNRHSVVLEASAGPLSERQTFYEPAQGCEDKGPTTAMRMARYEERAPSLAADAARRALVQAGTKPDEVTHLVTVSCTGFFAPGVDASLVELLGLPRGVERTHIGFMGCHGALNGLRAASAFAQADPGARVLICAVELCSLHLTYGSNSDSLVANAIFGDGAAAVVGCGEPKNGCEGEWQVVANGTHLLPDSTDAMTWRIGTHGFRMTLSPKVPEVIQGHLAAWLEGWLEQQGLRLGDVASWAVHPGGPRILQAVEGALDLTREDSAIAREILAGFGNMSSPTILFIIDRMRARNTARPCVALAFGPGLVVEAALLR